MRMYKAIILCATLTMLCVPIAAQDGGPSATVTAFLNAWSAKDSAAMWNTLSRESQEAYPQQVFENRYTVANTAMGLERLTFEVGETHIQGITAAVDYDVVLISGMFGTIEDPDRTMRLVNENGRWGVAWSSMDIFEELPSVGELTSAGQLKPRGQIYDRNGQLVAGRGTVITMYTARQNMADEEGCKNLVSNITRRPYAAFDQLFALYTDPVTIFYLGHVNQADYDANRDALTTICGVNITLDHTTRTYYANNAMSHVAGYVGQMSPEQQEDYVSRGYSVGDVIGQSGVERMLERALAGTPDRVLRITEPGGAVLREFASTGGQNPVPVQITIDRELQRVVAQAMFDAYDYAYGNWGQPVNSSEGAAVVLDVRTGEILAMVSYPLFDPLLFDPNSQEPAARNELLGRVVADTRRPLRNHAIEDNYSPGSTYKLVTAAAAMNEGITEPGEIFDCQYVWSGQQYGDEFPSRTDWRNDEDQEEFPPAGLITPAQAIMASCNPFFYQMGAELFNAHGNIQAEYARKMGLGAPYNIFGGTMVEARAELDNPTAASLAINVAVGQGNVVIPPIQMAALVAGIANGGTVYKPYLVKQVGGLDGTEVQETFEPEVLSTLDFKPGVLEEIQEGMCGATTDEFYGTAWRRFNEPYVAPYTVCGKTGTAQTLGNANAWFVSYAPAENPEIAIVVMNSQTLHGSQVSAPITRRILDHYFNVPELAPYPEWWFTDSFQPLVIPVGSTGG
jgi:penicillin-binding protein 2